jgi:hypothetical protein
MSISYINEQISIIQNKIEGFSYILQALRKIKDDLIILEPQLLSKNDTKPELDISHPVWNRVSASPTTSEMQNQPTLSPSECVSTASIDAIHSEMEEESRKLRDHIEKRRKLMEMTRLCEEEKQKDLKKTNITSPDVSNVINNNTTKIKEEIPIYISPLMRYSKEKQKYIMQKLFNMASTNTHKKYENNNISDAEMNNAIKDEADKLLDIWIKSEENRTPMFIIPG